MIQKALANYPFIGLACISLAIFFGVFAGVVGRTFFGRRAREAQLHAAALPLHDDPATIDGGAR